MNKKIIQNQENLASGIFHQMSHKFDQQLGIHDCLTHHETHPATVGDGQYHPDIALLGNQPDH